MRVGLIVALGAVGLSLVLSTTGLANFAHGELFAVGAVGAFFLNTGALGPQLHLVPATLLAVVAAAALAAGLERGLWRPLRARGAGPVRLHLVAVGLAVLIGSVLGFLWYLLVPGGALGPYHQYATQRPLRLGALVITPRDVVIIVLAGLVLTAVVVVLTRTGIGKATRALADDRALAASSGVDGRRVALFVWALAGGLAALGGVFIGVSENVGAAMGLRLLVLMLVAVIVGGLGTAAGAIGGGLAVGLTTELSTLWFPHDLKLLWALVLLLVVLRFRPVVAGVR